jgi:hypothetical protein
MAFNDCFFFMGCALLLGAILALFFKQMKPAAGGAAGHWGKGVKRFELGNRWLIIRMLLVAFSYQPSALASQCLAQINP